MARACFSSHFDPPDPRTHAQPPIECNAPRPGMVGRHAGLAARDAKGWWSMLPAWLWLMADVCGWLHEMQKAVETVTAPYLVVLVRDSTWNRVGGRNPREVGSNQVIVK